ncbi:MAG: hypothetical protein WC465_00630 [Patescibacteria group bacterium]
MSDSNVFEMVLRRILVEYEFPERCFSVIRDRVQATHLKFIIMKHEGDLIRVMVEPSRLEELLVFMREVAKMLNLPYQETVLGKDDQPADCEALVMTHQYGILDLLVPPEPSNLRLEWLIKHLEHRDDDPVLDGHWPEVGYPELHRLRLIFENSPAGQEALDRLLAYLASEIDVSFLDRTQEVA